ncbi:hypothetical protein P5673_011948 [Acropora cervicornis]|uniref:Uncharacterized protein n=1 Tax=Acropora cervicornis TaxID=6130 RepID=A0AAD9QP21_ACRCE|nr:hypothetical protein P5673_011948 [Acropora cervicornis]
MDQIVMVSTASGLPTVEENGLSSCPYLLLIRSAALLMKLTKSEYSARPLLFKRSFDEVWGPHTVDRFANFLNSWLPRFNSRYWNLDTEDIDCFVLN